MQRMSKFDTDIFLMKSFSEEHKRVEKSLRQQMGLTDSTNLCKENLKEVPIQVNEITEDKEFLDEIRTTLSQSGLDVWLKKKEQEQMERDAKVCLLHFLLKIIFN